MKKTKLRGIPRNLVSISTQESYFFLCLFFLKRFLRLWVDILCLFLFLPLGIVVELKG